MDMILEPYLKELGQYYKYKLLFFYKIILKLLMKLISALFKVILYLAYRITYDAALFLEIIKECL